MPEDNFPTFLTLDDLVWPLSARYHITTPFGSTQHELHVDAPGLNGDEQHSLALLPALWAASIATAISFRCRINFFEYVIWKARPLPQIGISDGARGSRFETPAGREESGVLLFHTGHADNYAARRVFAAGMPRNWQSQGLLTERGWDGMMQWAHMMSMGMSSYFNGGQVQLLLAYPGLIPPKPENITGIAFRLVTDIRVCQYTDKAPEGTVAPWF